MTVLIDSNVLIGIAVDDHEHHLAAAAWFAGQDDSFATCPITEAAVVRHVVRNGRPAQAAVAFLTALAERSAHRFWPDDLAMAEISMTGVIGHRQVTDAYLAELARRHRGRLATFDRGLASLHADIADLVPVS